MGENEKTVLTPRGPQPGISQGNALPVGTRLAEFELTGLIGEGGFGIVYLAYDHSLHRRVALKEYMPSSLATRAPDGKVVVQAERLRETFDMGMRSFINEARLLAQYDHPSLVKVYRFWEDNGTAYLIMPYYEGKTLKQALKEMKEPPSEEWLRACLYSLLDALAILHADNCFHRDIAPDNIILLPDGQPLLLDFGAARRVITDMTQALTIILKPGFAPLEQYAEVPHMKQGAWTDIYALAAVVYYVISGSAPTPSVGRIMSDTLVPLMTLAKGRYSEGFLRTIDRALAVKPEDRPQSVAELRALLDATDKQPRLGPKPSAVGSRPPTQTTPEPMSSAKSMSSILLVGAVILLAALGGGGVYLWHSMVAPVDTGVPPAPVTPADKAPNANQVDGGVPVVPPKMPTGDKGGVATGPVDPLDVLDRIYQARDRDHSVFVAPDKTQVRIGKDKLSFKLSSSRAGYLYIFMVGTDRAHLYLLFPNAVDKQNQVAENQQISLPRPGWSMVAGGPAGSNQFVAVVSEFPRDFGAVGLKPVESFAEIPLDAAAGTEPSGSPACPGNQACSAAYGAAAFSIEEI
jgi:serine/threonine protein kinase